MRRILAASLLLPSLFLPAVAKASTPVDDATAPTPIRVSTGVTEPVLMGSASLMLPEGFSVNAIPNDAQVGLSLTVDEKGQPKDIAQAVKFLASEAASYITGHVLDVNGGMFMGA